MNDADDIINEIKTIHDKRTVEWLDASTEVVGWLDTLMKRIVEIRREIGRARVARLSRDKVLTNDRRIHIDQGTLAAGLVPLARNVEGAMHGLLLNQRETYDLYHIIETHEAYTALNDDVETDEPPPEPYSNQS